MAWEASQPCTPVANAVALLAVQIDQPVWPQGPRIVGLEPL